MFNLVHILQEPCNITINFATYSHGSHLEGTKQERPTLTCVKIPTRNTVGLTVEDMIELMLKRANY